MGIQKIFSLILTSEAWAHFPSYSHWAFVEAGLCPKQRLDLLTAFVPEESLLRAKLKEEMQELHLSHQRLPQHHRANGYPQPVTETNSLPEALVEGVNE